MSLNVTVCWFRDGEPVGIDERTILDAFANALVSEGPNTSTWRLEYDSEACDLFVSHPQDGAIGISGLTISRPLADERLWEAMYRLIATGDGMVFFPGCPAPLIADRGALEHIPGFMLAALGTPVIVRSGRDMSLKWGISLPAILT